MFRTLTCLALALAVTAAAAADPDKKAKKKAAAPFGGEILKVDAEKGTLTLKVTVKKKMTEEREVKVSDKTAVTVIEGEKKTELTGNKPADLLKKEQFKVGATVVVEMGERDGAAKSLTFGGVAPAKKKKKDAK